MFWGCFLNSAVMTSRETADPKPRLSSAGNFELEENFQVNQVLAYSEWNYS